MGIVARKGLGGVEDLLLSMSTEEQTRSSGTKTITGVNASNIPYDAITSIKAELDKKLEATEGYDSDRIDRALFELYEEYISVTPGGETSFTVTDNTDVWVMKNGVKLTITTDYTLNGDGVTIDLVVPMVTGEIFGAFDMTRLSSLLDLKADKVDTYLKTEVYNQTEIDNLNSSHSVTDVLRNGAVSNGVLALDTVSEVGSKPVLYVGNGTGQDVATPMQIANDNGDGTTLAADWAYVGAGDYAIDDIVIDNSTTGDARAYRNLTGVNTTTSPLLDATNWVLETNQYGGRFHFKSRSVAYSNVVLDTVRREGYVIVTDTTNIEGYVAASVTSFNPFSISVSSYVAMNENLSTYVLWIDQTTRKTPGYRTDAGVIQNSKNNTGTDLLVKDSAGNPIIEHYNPTTGFSIIMDTGDGSISRNAPISCQKKPLFFTRKQLTTTARSWYTYDKVNGAGGYMLLDSTAIFATSTTVWNSTEPTVDAFSVGNSVSSNGSGEQYITYYQCETDNHKLVGYAGTGVVGNEINLGLDMTEAGSWCRIKAYSAVGSWFILDNIRVSGALDGILYADSSNAESITTDVITLTATGVTLKSTTSANASGTLYIIEAYSPTYNNPTSGNEIGVNTGKDITYTDGIGNVNLVETTATHTVDCSALAGDTAYIVKEQGSNAVASLQSVNVGKNRADADKFGRASGAYKTTDVHSDFESATGSASADTYTVGYEPWRALNNKEIAATDSWFTAASVVTGEWFYKLKKPRALNNFRFRSSTAPIGRYPKDYTVKGRNNGGAWSTLYTIAGDSIADVVTWSAVKNSSDTATLFDEFGIFVTANNGDINNLAIGEIEFNFTIDSSPYINTTDNIVYDGTDTKTNLVVLGEVKVDSQGNTFDLVEYSNNKSYFNELVATGNVDIYGGFDLHQQFVDMTTIKAPNVMYKNKTGKPVWVSISFTAAAAPNASLKVDGKTLAYFTDADTYSVFTLCALVPPESEYIVTVSSGYIQTWFELI